MVIGAGLDLVETDRVDQALARWDGRLVARLMGPEEAARLPPAGEGRARALALAIAAKEATSKALGTGWTQGVRWRDVELVAGPPPRVRLHAAAAARAHALGSAGECLVSLLDRDGLVIGEVWLLGR
jgi:holo-[acyl-carrier protein] synthase